MHREIKTVGIYWLKEQRGGLCSSLSRFSSKTSILAGICSILFLSFCTSSLARWRSAEILPLSRNCLSASRKRCLSSLVDLLSSAMIFSAFGPRTFLNLSVKDLSRSDLSFWKCWTHRAFPKRNYFSFISCFAKPDWAKFGDIDFFLWIKYLPAPKHIPRLKFDESTSKALYHSLEGCFNWSLSNWVKGYNHAAQVIQ